MSELETLPLREKYSFCKWLGKTVEKYFEDPEVQKRFEKWKEEKERRMMENGEKEAV